MNILFLSGWFPIPPDNGSRIRVYHLLKALSAQHKVTLLAFAFGTAQTGRKAELSHLCKRVRVIECNPIELNESSAIRRFVSVRPVASRPLDEMTSLVNKTATSDKFDAVIASTDMMSAYALEIPEKPVRILELHNSLSRWMHERYHRQTNSLQIMRCWFSWKKAQLYESNLFQLFDLVTMVSTQDSLEPLAGHRIKPARLRVVPNGVDCGKLRPDAWPKEPFRLIFNGALNYRANYDAAAYFLAEIMPLIRQKAPDVTLTITGSTEGVDLSGIASDSSVYLSGYVEDVRALVGSAAIAVAPIREGGGTRLKILEAMALGTPVVATSKAAEGLEVVDGEHLLLADTPHAFSERTLHLLGNARDREAIARRARKLVEEKYDWRDIGRLFVSLVEEAVNRAAR